MSEHWSELLSLEVTRDRNAPRITREAVRALSEIGAQLDDAVLVASELVSALVLASREPAQTMLEVTVKMSQDRLVIVGHDPTASPDAGKPVARAAGNLGWRIVEQLAEHWDVSRAEGYLVWAELAIPA